jgi:hypothetical protein
VSSLSSVIYIQPNSLTTNIKEKIDELNRKIIITNCTLKHLNQKENVLVLAAHFKEVVTNILYQLDQELPDYNTLNFNKLNDELEKAYKDYWMRLFKHMKKLT